MLKIKTMTDIQKIKLLLDYNRFLKECVSTGVEPNKETIKEYLTESYYFKKAKI